MGTDADERKWPEGINPKKRLEQLTDDELLTIVGWFRAAYRWKNASKKDKAETKRRMSASQMLLSPEERSARARKAGLARARKAEEDKQK